jgi:DNA-binding FrmR family transcriptional regulator
MRDDTCTDILKRLACTRGHLEAIVHMVERGEDDLAVAHQIQAVGGAITQIQVRLLRAWLSECNEQLPQPATHARMERDLKAILKIRK